jgi:hypothetical protein
MADDPDEMLNVLDRVRESLRARHADLRYTEADGTIVVHAPVAGGFDVSISEELVVGFDGWHEHFETPEEALECFAFGFSDQCRLKVTYRGRFACKWTLESLEDGRWVEDSTTGLVFFPFWRAARVEYRQNGLLKDEGPAAATKAAEG